MPQLDRAERDALEESILEEACRDALVAWDSPEGLLLLDGHNRLEICTRHDIPFDVHVIDLADLADRAACLDWIDRNQLGRRNLSPGQLQLLRGRRFNRRKSGWGGRRDRSKPQLESMKTAEILAREMGVSRATIERDGRYAEAVEQLRDIDPELEHRILAGVESPSRSAIVEAAQLAVHDPEAGWRRLRGTMTSSSIEWTSPRALIAEATRVLETIDLDPASPLEVERRVVPASNHYTLRDDGLRQPWNGRVWLNPPYGRELPSWVDKLLHEYEAGRCTEALLLVPVRSDCEWWARLRDFARCFVRGRLRFRDEAGAEGTAPFASAIVYLGPNLDAFRDVFGNVGDIYVLLE
jgi:hypothetical protein